MDTVTLRVFQREVAKQGRFALTSVNLLNGATAGMQELTFKSREQRQMDWDQQNALTNQLWFALQAFLIAAANISKLLWGTKAGTNAETWGRRKRERLQLRTSLGVADNSILQLSPASATTLSILTSESRSGRRIPLAITLWTT